MQNEPHTNLFNSDIEEIILGSIISNSMCLVELGEPLNPNYFYFEKHKNIASAINDLLVKGEPIDLITVPSQLKAKSNLIKSGGASYIVEITSRVMSVTHFEKHFRILQQFYIIRKTKEQNELLNYKIDNENPDAFDIIDQRQKDLNELTSFLNASVNTDKNELFKQFKERNKKLLEKNGVTGVPSGFNKLDENTAGWQNSDFIVIAARPGMGKTSFILQNAINASIMGFPVAIFSLEMSALQLLDKAVSSISEIPLSEIQRTGLTKDRETWANNAFKQLIDMPLIIDDTPSLNIHKLRSKSLKLKIEKNISMIIIDYLQLMSSKGGNREQEVSEISRGLKALAKELNVPVIALAQLSRSVETRGGEKRPMLSDLRDSGAIEQDADFVGFLYRPEYYGIDEIDHVSTKGDCNVIIAKHRNGSLDEITLTFKPEISKFTNWIDPNDYTSKLNSNKPIVEPYKKILPDGNF
jgi:replicative DNA helicase